MTTTTTTPQEFTLLVDNQISGTKHKILLPAQDSITAFTQSLVQRLNVDRAFAAIEILDPDFNDWVLLDSTRQLAENKMAKLRVVNQLKRRRGQFSKYLPERQNVGSWTEEEKAAFLEGLAKCGKNWKKIFTYVKTRDLTQIRCHAQKYFKKQKKTSMQFRCGKVST